MSGKSMNFEDKKIKKINFYKNEKLFKIDDIDVKKTLASKKESNGSNMSIKYFTGYSDNAAMRPLCIMFPQMIGYVKCSDSNKTMPFKVSDNKLLESIVK